MSSPLRPSRDSLLCTVEEVDYRDYSCARTSYHEYDLNGRELTPALLDSELDSHLSKEQDCSPPILRLATTYNRSDCEESTSEGLTWRLDSAVSHSDWAIRIVGESTAVYHVHKTALSVGARKSGLFQRLFRQKRTVAHTTFRDLSDLEAEAFPCVLDYIYSGDLSISTENATAIHSLSHQFEIKSLRIASRSFWIKDLTSKTAALYFNHARQLGDKHVMKAVSLCCARNVEVLLDLDNEPYIDFVLSVLELPSIVPSCELSLVVAVFCKQNRSRMETATFYRLTAPLQGQLDPRAATALLQTQLSFVATHDDAAKRKSLTLRCIEELSKQWLSKKEQREVLALLPDSTFRECYLARCLDTARDDYASTKRAQKSSIESMNQTNKQLLNQYEDLKRKHAALAESNKQLQEELCFMSECQQRGQPQLDTGRNQLLATIIAQLNKCASSTN